MLIKIYGFLSKKPIYYLFALIFIFIFLFIRLYNISNSLEFFGDIGRDHLTLYEWWITGKIPLLGPGVSYFSLHLPPMLLTARLKQHPIYYYINFPIFLISRLSPYTTLITLLLIFIGVYIVAILTFKKREYLIAVFVAALLIIFHPQYILQTRLPWSPTFAAPFIGVAVFELLLLREKYSVNKFIIFSVSLAGAAGLSVETIPTVFAMIISALWILLHRIKYLYFFCFSIINFFAFNYI